MMTILFISRWTFFLDCNCSVKTRKLLPHIPMGETSSFGECPHISMILLEEDLQIAPPYSYGRDSSSLANLHTWSSYEWQASSIWSLRDDSSWSCTTFLHPSLYWCLEDTHDVSPNLLFLQDILDISSIITWPIFELLLWLAHWSSLDLLLFLLISTLTPTYGPSIDYGLNLQIYLNETLVHRDCH